MTMNVAPLPTPGLFARTLPPCSSTSCLTIDSPSPSPPWRRVVAASTNRSMLESELVSTRRLTREEILRDYRLACESRQASLMGRKEVFMGKAKFGIFGDGKEIPQLAMAKY